MLKPEPQRIREDGSVKRPFSQGVVSGWDGKLF